MEIGIQGGISDDTDSSVRRRQLKNWAEKVKNADSVASDAWKKGSTRIVIISLLLVVTFAFHSVVLCLWGWLPWTRHRNLPKLFVFPRIEVLLCTATYLGTAEAAGLLITSQSTAAISLGALTLIYLVLLTGDKTYWCTG